MHLYPMLKELEENAKVMDYLNTEITTRLVNDFFPLPTTTEDLFKIIFGFDLKSVFLTPLSSFSTCFVF